MGYVLWVKCSRKKGDVLSLHCASAQACSATSVVVLRVFATLYQLHACALCVLCVLCAFATLFQQHACVLCVLCVLLHAACVLCVLSHARMCAMCVRHTVPAARMWWVQQEPAKSKPSRSLEEERTRALGLTSAYMVKNLPAHTL